MEENKQLDPKTESTGSDNGEGLVSITKEELARFQGIERDYKASTKEAQQLKAISECGADERAFAKYYKNDRKLAERIAKHYNRGSADDLMESLREKYGDNIQEPVNSEDIRQEAKNVVNEQLARASLDEFIAKKGLKKGEKSYNRFMSEFQDLIDGKEFTKENVDKASSKARKLILDDNMDLAGVPFAGGGRSGSVQVRNEQPQSIFEAYGKKK